MCATERSTCGIYHDIPKTETWAVPVEQPWMRGAAYRKRGHARPQRCVAVGPVPELCALTAHALHGPTPASHHPGATVFLFGVSSVPVPEHVVPVGWGSGKFSYSLHEEVFKIVFICVWDFFWKCGLCFFKAHLRNGNAAHIVFPFPSHVSRRGASSMVQRDRMPGGGAPTHPISQEAFNESRHLCIFSTLSGRHWLGYFLNLLSICNPWIPCDQIIWEVTIRGAHTPEPRWTRRGWWSVRFTPLMKPFGSKCFLNILFTDLREETHY